MLPLLNDTTFLGFLAQPRVQHESAHNCSHQAVLAIQIAAFRETGKLSE